METPEPFGLIARDHIAVSQSDAPDLEPARQVS
jgi:hypothetical protein